MSKKQYNIKHIPKEESKQTRIIINGIISLIVLVFIVISGILFNIQTQKTLYYGWWSNLFLNLAAGTAITAFFLHFSNARLRKYKVYVEMRNLHNLINHLQSTLIALKFKQDEYNFLRFSTPPSEVNIDFELFEANKPTLYKKWKQFQTKIIEIKSEILEDNGIDNNTTNDKKIEEIIMEKGIHFNPEHIERINRLQEDCMIFRKNIENAMR